MATSDVIINQSSFWVGIIGTALILIWLFTIRVNKKKIFQSKFGRKSLQSDRMVVGGAIGLGVCIILTASGFGYASYALIIIPVLLILILSKYPEISKPLWRGIKKVVSDGFNSFVNLVSSIFTGNTRKK